MAAIRLLTGSNANREALAQKFKTRKHRYQEKTDSRSHVTYDPHSLRSCASVPLNLSRSQRPIPATLCGVGPIAPSVYCHMVQVSQLIGTTGVGPYCANQNQQLGSTGSLLLPSSCFM